MNMASNIKIMAPERYTLQKYVLEGCKRHFISR